MNPSFAVAGRTCGASPGLRLLVANLASEPPAARLGDRLAEQKHLPLERDRLVARRVLVDHARDVPEPVEHVPAIPHERASAIGPDGSFIVSASQDHTLKIWDATTGEQRATFTHAASVGGCAVSPDGSFVVSVNWDNTRRVWKLATGEEVTSLELPGPLECVTLHPSRPLVLSGDAGGTVYFLDLVGIAYGP